jgi:hypothetical protein
MKRPQTLQQADDWGQGHIKELQKSTRKILENSHPVKSWDGQASRHQIGEF